jgi:YgiT-type zinc finger domain-containing protein
LLLSLPDQKPGFSILGSGNHIETIVRWQSSYKQQAKDLFSCAIGDLEMTEDNKRQAEATPLCPECHAGVLRLQYLTYFTWLNQELITVPNFPSWVCDVCGRREYDPRAISWLNTLLNPNAGRRSDFRRKSTPPQIDRPQP